MTLAFVALGGVLGALLRFGTHNIVPPLTALLIVNGTGSLIAGMVAQKAQVVGEAPNWVFALIVIGFCGALTTFSGYALELVKLLHEGQFFKVACHFFLNNAMCLILCYIGYSKIPLG